MATTLALIPSAIAAPKTASKAAGRVTTTVVNTILSGVGVPSKTLGINGDFYIDTKNLNLYGPKIKGVWKVATSLKQIDTKSVTTVIGEAGSVGEKGDKGDKGATGSTGATGVAGAAGAAGAGDTFQGRGVVFDLRGDLRGGGAPINRNRGPGGSWPGAAAGPAVFAAPLNRVPVGPAVASAVGSGSITTMSSVAVFGRANRRTLNEIVQDKVIVHK
jgi:hypothetical protein